MADSIVWAVGAQVQEDGVHQEHMYTRVEKGGGGCCVVTARGNKGAGGRFFAMERMTQVELC